MNQLTDNRRESIVHQLLYGEQLIEIKGTIYKAVSPSPQIYVLANNLYDKLISENRFGFWLTDRDCLQLLVNNNLCSPAIDSNLKEIVQNIENLKADLYSSLFQDSIFKKTRKTLDMVKSKHLEMLRTRHMFDHLTLKGYVEMAKRQFIIANTLYYYDDNKKVYENWEDMDILFIDLVIGHLVEISPTIEQLREVARTDPWRAIWHISNHRPFNKSASFLNSEQRTVIQFSQMYDSIYKHPECPPDDVIEDDDLVDGWMITERRKREKSQMTKQVQDRLQGRHSGANEVFLPAKSREEAKKIEAYNDTQAIIIKKQRQALIKNRGEVKDSQFIDQRLQMQQEANQQFIKQVKERK